MKEGIYLAIFLLVLMLNLVSANVLNVPTDYSTIQGAINNASNGDTINISAGTYIPANLNWDGFGYLRVNKSLILVGVGSLNTIINGQHLHSVIGGGSHATCLWLESSNVTLKGLTIKGCDWGIRVSDAYVPSLTEISDLIFNDVTFTDNYGHGIVFENYSGVVFKRVEFIDSNANANGDRGIYISPTASAEDFTLTNTNANDNRKAGFNCQGTLDGLIINGGEFNRNTGGLNYEGNGPYFGAGLELDGVSNAEINGIETNENGLLGPNDCGNAFWNTPPFSMTGGAGILLKDDTSSINILNSELKNNANGIMVEWCKHWPTSSQPNNINISFDEIEGNVNYGILNRAPLSFVDAKNNWWGDCTGPSGVGSGTGDSVSANVTYSPWLGICITDTDQPTCAIENENLTLNATINGNNFSSIIFSININNTWMNKTGTLYPQNSSIAKATISSSEVVSGQNITWYATVKDTFGNEEKSSINTFYIRQKTQLTTNPSSPNGLNGWFINEPEFTLSNPAPLSSIFYRWDGMGPYLYSLSFKLENTPNNASVSGGILELTYWANFTCGAETKKESEQKIILKFDFAFPVIKDIQPENGSIIYSGQRPLINALIDEIYQSNSGINQDSINLFLDGDKLNPTITKSGDLDLIVSYIPTFNLAMREHIVKLNATDNAGHYSERIWTFRINLSEPFNITVNSPINTTYNSRNIQFKVTATKNVDLWFINYGDKHPKLKKLCSNCNEYGISRKKNQILNEGWNNITIIANDSYGSSKQENIRFFIDSKPPKISQIFPRRSAVINGSEFFIKYTENNPLTATLFFNPNITLQNCTSGKNVNCSTSVDLSEFDGQFIDFYFELNDSINLEKSKETRVLVDTTSPILSVNDPVNDAEYENNKVPFRISISEKVLLEYYDEYSPNPRWKHLCVNCDSYGETRVKTERLNAGTHSIIIRAVDKAGNSDTEEITFTVQ